MASEHDHPSDQALARLVQPGSPVYFTGCLPSLPAHLHPKVEAPILQMTYARQASAPGTSPVVVRDLGEGDVPAMLALTALVYPEFFRQRTRAMGRYVGVFDGDALVAMGGERFRLQRHQEVSAICTHPSYTGRGCAHAIVRNLVESILDRRLTPILHLATDNHRARAVYSSLGFVERTELRLLKAESRAE